MKDSGGLHYLKIFSFSSFLFEFLFFFLKLFLRTLRHHTRNLTTQRLPCWRPPCVGTLVPSTSWRQLLSHSSQGTWHVHKPPGPSRTAVHQLMTSPDSMWSVSITHFYPAWLLDLISWWNRINGCCFKFWG